MPPKKFATLATIGNGGGRSPSNSGDEDEDRQLYVGGSEHSGQAVLGPADPNKLVRNVMDAAKQHGAEAVDDSGPSAPAPFGGGGAGRRMGDAAAVDDDEEEEDEEDAVQVPVTLQMWQNGFSIDGGELRLYDDPASKEFMKSIMQGRIPAELTTAYPGREIDLRMEDHRGEEYKAPPKKPFSGTGMRLGSIVPGQTTSAAPVVEAAPKAAPAPSAPSGPVLVEGYNANDASTQVQIRLVNGKRLVAKANTSSIVGTLRNLIVSVHPEYAAQPFQLLSTYPSKVIDDETVTIQEAGLANAVIMQKLTM